MDDKNKQQLLIIAAGILLFCASVWLISRTIARDDAARPSAQPNTNINLDGALASDKQPQVIYLQGKNTTTREVVYLPKEVDPATGRKEKTDVELNTQEKAVFVKINGKEHEVPIDIKESSKMESGKLVVTDTSRADINITGPDPAKWSLSYLRNLSGEQAVGVSYGISKVLKAKVLFIEHQKPFFGIEASLGDLRSRPSPKRKVQKEPISSNHSP